MAKILDHFPLSSPRPAQVAVLEDVVKTFDNGAKIVLLEAPVGSGKSAIAVALARYYQQAHILTPRKSLQDQYYADFKDHLVLMKGRGAYPCTLKSPGAVYRKIIDQISEGYIRPPERGTITCKTAPCTFNHKVKIACTNQRPCPYAEAAAVASDSDVIVHNFHSFIFQTWFGGSFTPRPILIIDEAHDAEKIIREFGTKTLTLPFHPKAWEKIEVPTGLSTVENWCDWFITPTFTRKLSSLAGSGRSKETSELTDYLSAVQDIKDIGTYFGDRFSHSFEVEEIFGRQRMMFKITPEYIGNLFKQYISGYGARLLMMSGTIYDKTTFCRNLGINPDLVSFRRIPSTFPVKNRPIYMVKELMVNTSHAEWDKNFPSLITSIKRILDKFPEEKGLIHTPSYLASAQIKAALKNPRIVSHEPEDFDVKLEAFYGANSPLVFMSPVCQQGVDFKDDRARFQLILRVPYPSLSDSFIKYKMDKDPSWYTYQAFITFGQQLGRINRSETDEGITILIDDRFPAFIRRNKKLPTWLTDSFIYKETMK